MSESSDSPSGNDTGPDSERDSVVELPAQFDLRSSAGVADALQPLSGKVTVIADKVEMMTSPGLQVLISAVKDGARELEFEAPSRGFLDCMTLLGSAPEKFKTV